VQITRKEVFNVFFVDGELNTSLTILGSILAIQNAGHKVVGEADSVWKTKEVIRKLKDENVTADHGVVDGLNGRGKEVANMLMEAFPGIFILGFSASKTDFGHAWVAKSDSKNLVPELEKLK
jgi:hypothetical protein